LIKYKGLGYEDAVWEKVPHPDEGERWTDFKTAYEDWVLGRYTTTPKTGALKARLEKVRATKFPELEKTKQAENLTGGELMGYQLEGMNWIYHQWHQKKNGILADEMGLGKTIQVIAYMAMMRQDHNCFPFLVVVPNSTCPNWRREIKQWAPSLRVVAYYGSSTARQMAHKYELFPDGGSVLHCHVVVTSYEAVIDESTRRCFRSVSWQALFVDEGQRLKNDQSIIHEVLTSLKVPFRMLMTGTPLQNNARELFNLLQFLDDSVDAKQMEEEYQEMTKENIQKLHDIIRPFILRRTKAQVLTFLPPMAQIIVPISMSMLQKKVYKSIMAKNPDLLRSLFTSSHLKQGERANLNNILMQLRKCLCHPFVYSQDIEERNLQKNTLHRNLVEASAKLQLLEVLLPKLQERGHRVLIFSQFLDMLDIIEDFLDGMEMRFQRLDGRISSLEKQKRIDEFNAPESPLFAFLLSTRAGGVGINLTTADTVIILDPDFNPHQDIQAISRAHRIGQTKKVLAFQMVTRASAEEKIVQIGRKKIALDHVVVNQLDAEDLADKDVEGILRHGAAELFADNDENDIRYDAASIDKLLDRSEMENTSVGADNSAESQFSFARVWANDAENLDDDLGTSEDDTSPNPGLWETIMAEREKAAAAEAAARAEIFGRGRRAKAQGVIYDASGRELDNHLGDSSDSDAEPPQPGAEVTAKAQKHSKSKKNLSDSDTDFRADFDDEGPPSDEEPAGPVDLHELEDKPASQVVRGIAGSVPAVNGKPIKFTPVPVPQPNPHVVQYQRGVGMYGAAPVQYQVPAPVMQTSHQIAPGALEKDAIIPSTTPSRIEAKEATRMAQPTAVIWKRAQPRMNLFEAHEGEISVQVNGKPVPAKWEPRTSSLVAQYPFCAICNTSHPLGSCPLKLAGTERCPLCGIAHFGHARQCPHIKSETMVRLMLDSLRSSPEDPQLVELATKYLKGVKGHLVQNKRRAKEEAEAKAKGLPWPPLNQPPPVPRNRGGHGTANPIPPRPLSQVPQQMQFRPYAPSTSTIPGMTAPPPTQQSAQQPDQPPVQNKAVEQRLMEALGGLQ